MTAAELNKPSYSCIHFVDESQMSILLSDLSATKLRVTEIGVNRISSKGELLTQLGRALEFPGYVGANWDALEEALRDLEWAPAAGYVVFVRNSRHLWASAAEVAGMFLEIWLTAAKMWAESRVPFHLVFAL